MKKYNSYKDSGIEWIGEIPNHWRVKRFGHLFSFSRGLGITKQDLKDEGIPCVNYGEIHSKYGFAFNPEIHPIKCVDESYLETGNKSLLKRGDFIFADTSEDIEGSGNFTVLDSDIQTFAGYHTVIARHENGDNYRYLAYCFDSAEFRNQIRSAVSGIKVFSITHAILKSSKIQLPSYPEQTAIASYLDRKTAEIDELIADKKRLLELYEEEITAMINQAVTKGINPDVPMKNSVIEWLGEIPEHWKVIPITKYLENIVDYRGRTPKKQNEGLFLVTARNIKNRKIDYTLSEEFVDEEDAQNLLNRGKPKIGDVLFTTEAPLGEVANIDREDIALAQRIIKFRGRQGVLDNYYLMYFMSSDCFKQVLYSFSTGSTAIGIKASKLHHLKCLLPSLDEQIAIVHHIETECTRIEEKKYNTEKLIELLKEYRTSLISEVVTGKLKVIE